MAIQLLMQQLAKNKITLKNSQINLPPNFIPRGST